MRVNLTLKNYRCFVQPVTIELTKGFTAFVGVNNAGKSAILRFIFEMRSLFERANSIGDLISSLSSWTGGLQLQQVIDPEEIFSNLNDQGLTFILDFFIDEIENLEKRARTPKKIIFIVQRGLAWRTEAYFKTGKISFPTPGTKLQGGSIVRAGSAIVDFSELQAALSILSNSLYIGPFRNTINIGTKSDYLDIQIGDSFLKNFRTLKTGPTKRQNTAISVLTEEIKRIFNFNSLDISPSADDASLHITINGKPYKQHELGSGLSQFILVLANALVKQPKLILIDEPELNLHPTLQLDFLTALATTASEAIWFSTHSIGLARSAAERVYSVQRVSDGNSIVRPLEGTSRLPEFLGEMSFSSYKELGFEKILLVEGPTEVKVIQRFLRAMNKDHKVVLLPMHGALPNQEQLEEVLRITTSVAALIDSEKKAENDPLELKRENFVKTCENNNISIHVLHRRAIENYFPDQVVQQVFGSNYRGLHHFELLKEVTPHWNKNENWKLAAAMSLAELDETDLGKFLRTL